MNKLSILQFLLLSLPFYLGTRIGLYKLFKEAGLKPFLAFIPIVSWYYWIVLIGKPKWYFLLRLIPAINVIIWFGMKIDIVKCFGGFKLKEQVLGVLFPYFYLPYLAYVKKSKYMGTVDSKDVKTMVEAHSSFSREWLDAAFFAVIVAYTIRTFYYEPYKIPTPSMESTMKVGDYLVVSKNAYGARIPITPLAIPFVHQQLGGFPTYLDWLQLPYLRLPGIKNLKRRDKVVFNYPQDKKIHPIDQKTHYVKRCVGIPGDSLEVIKGFVHINGKVEEKVPGLKFGYVVKFKKYPMNDEMAKKWDLYSIRTVGTNTYNIHMTDIAAHDMATYNDLDTMYRTTQEKGEKQDMPYESPDYKDYEVQFSKPNSGFVWNANYFGPIYVPKAGDVLLMNKHNYSVYKVLIERLEKAGKLSMDANENILLNGKIIKEFKVKWNYYWMMGDNRDISLDARFWGFVPENHIVGKPSLIVLSKQTMQYDGRDVKMGIRWGRMFKFP